MLQLQVTKCLQFTDSLKEKVVHHFANDGKSVRKISGLEKDEMNNDGTYVCSQYSKLIGHRLETVCYRLDTEV